jgi:hypothetical protein
MGARETTLAWILASYAYFYLPLRSQVRQQHSCPMPSVLSDNLRFCEL